MADSARLFELLDHLIDRWCERHALGPLRVLLPAYPPAPLHSDDWATLYAAVRHVRGLAPGELRPEESAAVAEAHALIYQQLKANPAGASIIQAAG